MLSHELNTPWEIPFFSFVKPYQPIRSNLLRIALNLFFVTTAYLNSVIPLFPRLVPPLTSIIAPSFDCSNIFSLVILPIQVNFVGLIMALSSKSMTVILPIQLLGHLHWPNPD